MVSHEGRKEEIRGLTSLCIRGRNKAKEGKVLRPDLDRPQAATKTNHEKDGTRNRRNHVTSRKGKSWQPVDLLD